MMAKRIFDIVVSAFALIILSPFLLAIAIWIKCDSTGPVFFRQARVARHGSKFQIIKFRTMHTNQNGSTLQITVNQDPRITNAGDFLRKYKLDELPQLLNVLMGDMSIVGPRPEVPKYVAHYPEAARKLILSVRPGITDNASIVFRDESSLLNASNDPEETYIQKILPIKIKHYIDYVENKNFLTDIKIIIKTIRALIS